MIKNLLSLSLIACFSAVSAQNIELRMNNGASTLINGTEITVNAIVTSDNNQDVEVKIDAKSVHTSTKTIRVKKIEKTSTAPLSENAICWGVCTIGVVWGVSPVVISDPVPMNASQTVLYSGHVYPKTQSGTTVMRYVWYDVANTSDSTWVDVKYVVSGTASVNENKKTTSLKLFPNPATNIVNVALNSNETNKKIEIMDMLGRKVFTKAVSTNNESFTVNTSNFLPGVYFVSVTSNDKAIRTEKIVITK